jgi:hypothetical protein
MNPRTAPPAPTRRFAATDAADFQHSEGLEIPRL